MSFIAQGSFVISGLYLLYCVGMPAFTLSAVYVRNLLLLYNGNIFPSQNPSGNNTYACSFFFFVYDHLSHHYYDVYVIRNVTSRCCCCCGCGCRNQSINHLVFSRRIVDFLRRISFCSVSGRSCAGSCTPQCQRELPTLVCAI